MQHPRLLLAAASLGLLASVLPVSAASGDVASIALRDFNRNGKIDRAVISFANPSLTNWTVRGMSGFNVTYKGQAVAVSDAFMASTSDPAVLEVVLEESDARLMTDTSATDFEVSYARVGVSAGVSDGSSELSAIATGDATSAATELDQAPPVLVSSTPEPGAVDFLRAEQVTLTFSEPINRETLVISSSSNPGGWFYAWIGEGRTVTVQHDVYQRNTVETFGATVKDLSGNALVTDTYPNPFTFQTSSDNTPNPSTDELLLITSPVSGSALTVGEATPIAWYTNMPAAASVILSYSTDVGATWTSIATVPASQKVYMWYPPRISGALQLKAEARSASNTFVNLSIVGTFTTVGSASVSPLRAVSAVEVTQSTATSMTSVVRLDRTPSTAVFSCNNGALTAPVVVTGDRPVRLSATLSNLADGTSYTCAFALTDAAGASFSLAAPTFVAGEDTKAPELTGAAVVDLYDAAAGTARLSWTTNEATTATVSYGAYLNYGSSAASTALTGAHSVTLSGLTPGAMHQARITSIDAKGNASVSKDFYFVFLRENDLVKGTGAAVYWYKGGKRYAFPNLDTYRSWFGNDFSKVLRVPDTQLGTIALGGNVKMKEGVYMIKIQSDPKTYAVEGNGVLRWIPTEERARALYGAAWATRVRDVDVSLFTDYTIGDPL
ncbi:MAG: Ig-like domain-containing protein [Patescibacteria group bacterium]|jgi:hypothetical protein